MKLYLTLEDGGLKAERVLYIDPLCPMISDGVLESMVNSVVEIKKDVEEEEIVLEARRLTVHND